MGVSDPIAVSIQLSNCDKCSKIGFIQENILFAELKEENNFCFCSMKCKEILFFKNSLWRGYYIILHIHWIEKWISI